MAGLFRRRALALPLAGPGRIVTVWGPTGSPGRSTLASALAGAFAQTGRVMLVDADQNRGALGLLLGVTGGGNVASAAMMPAPPGQPCRPRDIHVHHAGFALIRGVPGPAQDVVLDPADLAALLMRLRTHYDLILVDVGAALPPREFGDVHLAALRAADLVLAVGALTRLGLSDLLLQARALAERLDLQRIGPDGGPPVWCVLNKGRGSLMRTGPARVAAEAALPVVARIPLDARNIALSEVAHLPLTVARPHSPAASIVMGLAARVQRTLADVPCHARVGPDPENLRRMCGDWSG